MLTYQDFLKVGEDGKAAFVDMAIGVHKSSEMYEIAKTADLYDRQKNKTINEYVKTMFTLAGAPIEDFTASNNKIEMHLQSWKRDIFRERYQRHVKAAARRRI